MKFTKEEFDKKYAWVESKMINPIEWRNDLSLMIADECRKAIAEHEARQWHKYPEEMPEVGKQYIVTLVTGDCYTLVYRNVEMGFGYHDGNIIEFREIPKHYKEGGAE